MLGESVADLIDLLDHHRDKQVRLRRKVAIQRSDGDSGALRDLVHLDASKLLLGCQFLCRLQHPNMACPLLVRTGLGRVPDLGNSRHRRP